MTMEQGGAFSHHQSLGLPSSALLDTEVCLRTCLQLCRLLRKTRNDPTQNPLPACPATLTVSPTRVWALQGAVTTHTEAVINGQSPAC